MGTEPEVENRTITKSESEPDDIDDKKEPSLDQGIYDQMSEICKDMESALLLAVNPKNKELIIWYKGQQIEAAKMAAFFARTIRYKLNEDLKT